MKNHIILCGARITGRKIIEELKDKQIPFVVIDFDPDIIESLTKENLPALYGDVTHPEVLEYANIKKASLLISTIPDVEDNLFVITFAKEVNKKIIVICTAENVEDALKFYSAGADFVSIPKLVAGERLSSIIEKIRKNPEYLEKIRKRYFKLK